jgi:dTDP-4-dehydrorhamnose 3,5-epimerase-like enzyme|tara:strand:- start:479 stop:856 length:378 start_codon:yes stop_codon:yes gene_type:complete
MKKIKTKINYKDKRGFIMDLLEKKKINAITYITQNKGKVRGNHFHKKTTQWNYLMKGKIKVVAKKKNKKIKEMILLKGDLVVTSSNESHAIKAIKYSEYLVFTQGPRGGKEYENDTFRLTKPLIK